MGYEFIRFVGVIDEEFHCGICTMVLKKPLQSPCDHLFCSDCIKEWLIVNQSCPVDRHFLTENDLKPPARYFQNMLDKLDITCSFESQGCKEIIKLENLYQHQAKCVYNPNLEIVCDKGCQLTVKSFDYHFDCIVHLANRLRSQDEKVSSFVQTINGSVAKLNEEVSHLQAQVAKLNRDAISQQKFIAKLNDELKHLRPPDDDNQKCSSVRSSRPPQWRKTTNVHISENDPNIMEFGRSSGSGFAQLSYPLNETHHSFKTQILSDCGHNSNRIGIGLTQMGHQVDCPPGHSDGSIGYRCCGTLYYDKCESIASHACKVNDIVECGINFTKNFVNNGGHSVVVYFARNGLTFLKKMIRMPVDGLYPTIYLFDDHHHRRYVVKLRFCDL